MHFLRNETQSQNTKDSLDSVTCKIDSPIVSSAYNKIDPIEEKIDYDQDILHPGISIETINAKTNATDKNADDHKESANEIGTSKKGVKRNVLKIPPETLPCPTETTTTTQLPQPILDPVMPIQNEMKTYRFHEMSDAHKVCANSVLLGIGLMFFFT